MPLVFPALERNAKNHWNHAVLNLTQNLKKMLSEMDEDLVLACQRKLEEENSMSNIEAEKRKLTWERLETAASFKAAASATVAPFKLAACPVAC